MHSLSGYLALCGLLAASGTSGSLTETRQTCKNDAVIQLLGKFIPAAAPFCASYIGHPVPTVFVATQTKTQTTVMTIRTPIIPDITQDKRDEHRLEDRAALPVPTFLANLAAPAISSACSCLTVSATSTTTQTATSLVASPPGATCIVTYHATELNYGVGNGNTPIIYWPEGSNSVVSPDECCCRECYRRKNCVASAYMIGTCELLLHNQTVFGEVKTSKCPLGVNRYPFVPGPGPVFRGPCAA